ncbi:hypothetical protein LX64_04934 [Chitinophaga skermanii]|uniref:Tetratricopeptide repeat protein n=1 Tax=Chitinophaga skermanii TaxID=331697 RepID=A0A327Q1Z0_9BACT|nr:hypothetical protein [Chitinophaga skermanii]RAI97884.1 hypothetical protein LX64_04934 [Chitinophaga skermanii]
MKKLMVSLLLCGATMSVFAQRAKVNSAEDYYNSKNYDKANADIDVALQNEKTKNDAKAWYLKGKIMEAIALKDKSAAVSMESFDAFKKSLEINPKSNEAVLDLYNRMFNLYATVANHAYGFLNDQKWDSASNNFNRAFEIVEFTNSKNLSGTIAEDTAMVFYAGYVANQAGQSDVAFKRLSRAAELQYKGEPALYVVLGQLYEDKKDEAGWLKTIEQGKKLFPNDKRFGDMELNYYRKTNKTGELVTIMEKKLADNPNDFQTLSDYAIQLDNIANPRDDKGEDQARPANAEELMGKAEAAYKKALDIKPTDPTMNFQLGAVYFNRAAAASRELNAMDSKTQNSQKGKDLNTKVLSLMDVALPYFEKADASYAAMGSEIQPSDKSTYENCLIALSRIYAIKNQQAKVDEVKKKLEVLRG